MATPNPKSLPHLFLDLQMAHLGSPKRFANDKQHPAVRQLRLDITVVPIVSTWLTWVLFMFLRHSPPSKGLRLTLQNTNRLSSRRSKPSSLARSEKKLMLETSLTLLSTSTTQPTPDNYCRCHLRSRLLQRLAYLDFVQIAYPRKDG